MMQKSFIKLDINMNNFRKSLKRKKREQNRERGSSKTNTYFSIFNSRTKK